MFRPQSAAVVARSFSLASRRLHVSTVAQSAAGGAAPYVPRAALRSVEKPSESKPSLARPTLPTFYTGRPTYYDNLNSLETAVHYARAALTALQLYPLPTFARDSIPPSSQLWKDKDEMSAHIDSPLNMARYRRIIQVLNRLDEMKRIAAVAGEVNIYRDLEDIVAMFEKGNKDRILAAQKKKEVTLDEYGRSYTVGRRKTSSARVWIIPAKQLPPPPPVSAEELAALEAANAETPKLHLGESSSAVASSPTSQPADTEIPTQSINVLVNNRPLSQYFAIPSDREKVIRPFKITGTLGAYNVFAITRGGGTTGQSGAVALGIARGLAIHDSSVEAILRKGTHIYLSLYATPPTDMYCCSKTTQTRPEDGREEEDWQGQGQEGGQHILFHFLCPTDSLIFIQYAWVRR
jgi:small subunit ribosomal protein S9